MSNFELNKQIVLNIERSGLDFALSTIELRGFGDASEFWDYNLEGFTLKTGPAAVTKRTPFFATCALPMLDSIAPGI